MREGVPSRGCLTTKTALELPIAGKAIEARVRRLIDYFAALGPICLRSLQSANTSKINIPHGQYTEQ